MSPTLALLVQREAEISAFVAEPFYTVQLDCGFPATTGRMKDRKDADAIANACKGKAVTVKSVERKEKSEKAPALYDLTSSSATPTAFSATPLSRPSTISKRSL